MIRWDCIFVAGAQEIKGRVYAPDRVTAHEIAGKICADKGFSLVRMRRVG